MRYPLKVRETTENWNDHSENLFIEYDHREEPSELPEILAEQSGIESIRTELSAGDYRINYRIVAERKTGADFNQSIADARLFEQCKNLVDIPTQPVLIMEGNPYRTNKNVPAEAVRGALIAVTVFWYIPVLFSNHKEDTIRILKMIGNQDLSGRRILNRKNTLQNRMINDRRIHLLAGVPGIGPEKARKLLDEFSTLRDLMIATPEEIQDVPGIGPKLTENLREILDSKTPVT